MAKSTQTMLVPLEEGIPIALEKAIVFFGRSGDCDVVLNTSRKVSRKHCCIAQINDYYVIRDLGSMNGIRVNDVAVTDEHRLNLGDEIWIGDVGYRFAPLNPDAIKKAKELAASRPAPAGSGKNAGGKKAKRPAIDPALLSQDAPVAIPEKESRRPRKTAPKPQRRDKVIELDDSDIVDSDDEIMELSDDDLVDD